MQASRFLPSLAGAAILLAVLSALAGWQLFELHHREVVLLMLASVVVYAAAAWLVVRHDKSLDQPFVRRAVLLILAAALVMRLFLLFAPPMSSDIYRYVWDGRVQAAGINPYRYVPADAALGALRDPQIYPNINRATYATTIYPPMAQAIFLAVTRIAENVTVMKAAMLGFEAAAVWAILCLLRRRGLPPTRVLLYAWHPLPLFTFAGSGHLDIAAISLMLVACLAADRRHPALAGAILAGATLVKYFPLVIAPALYRRWDWRLPAAAIVTTIVLYLPYLGVGSQVLGFLPGYAQEEGLESGSGFFLLALLGKFMDLPPVARSIYLLLGLAVLAAIGLATLFRRAPNSVAIGSALALLVVFTVVLSPDLPWYFTWVVPFLCFRPSLALIYLTGAAPLLYRSVWWPEPVLLDAVLYLPFFVLLAIEFVARQRSTTKECRDDASHLQPRHAA